MSNYVSVTTIAAAAYAFYSGDYRYFAYAALSAYGDYSRANTQLEGPRLSDLTLGSSQYGTPIPWGFGTPRLPAQVWWASDKRPIAQTEGGKGGPGPEVTTYTYEIDVLLGLLDGPSKALSRVWSNGDLCFTRREGASDQSLIASEGSTKWRRLSFYNGSATQMPDPVYEAAVGVGNAPGYRNRSYVFIEGLQLGGSGQMPQLHFEVMIAGRYGVENPEDGAKINGANIGAGTPVGIGGSTLRVAIPAWDSYYATNVVNVFDVDTQDNTATSVASFDVVNSSVERIATGTADRPVLVTGNGSAGALYSVPGGARVSFTLSDLSGGPDLRYAVRGSDVVFANSSLSRPRKLYRHAAAGGSAIVTSAAMSAPVESLVVIGDTVYAAATGGAGHLYVLDLATLTLQATYSLPSALQVPTLFLLDDELALFGDFGALWTYRAGVWTSLGSVTSSYAPDNNAMASVCVAGGYLSGGRLGGGADTGKYITWKARLTADPTTQSSASIVDEICRRAGMPAGSWDTSALASLSGVRSFAVGQVMSARSVLEQLSAARAIDATLRDKLYFRARGGAAAATIPWDELGAGVDQADSQPLPLVWGSDLELPAQLAVTYYNANDDQQLGTEYSDRMVAGQSAMSQMQLAIGMTPTEAKNLADALQAESVAGLLATKVSLPLRYSRLDAGDVINVVAEDGTTYRVRATRKREDRGVLTLECVRDDPTVRQTSGLTDTTQQIANDVAQYAATAALALDAPLLRDEDDGLGWYVVTRGKSTPWPGCEVYTSGDGVTYSLLTQVAESAVHGFATTALPAFSSGTWDETSAVTVNVGPGALSSSTREAMDLDPSINVWLLGNEVLRARTATAVGAGVYTLTGLVRGLLGTEWAVGTHAANERAVLLTARGMRRIGIALSALGQTQQIKAVTLGALASGVVPFSFTPAGISQMPLAPWDVRATEGSGQDLLISWGRRSRLTSTPFAVGGVPLGEASESYRVRIYRASPLTLLRSVNASATSVVYSRSAQVADGVTAGTLLRFEVAQVSATVGEGYVATGTGAGTAQTLPQISTITLGGTFQSGSQLRAVIGGVAFTYTTTAGDATLAGAAASFAAVIDASPVLSASTSGAVITVTGGTGAPFSLVLSILVGDNVASYSVTQDAAAESPGSSYFAYCTISNNVTGETQPVPAGTRFTVEVQRPFGVRVSSFSYTTVGSESRLQVHGGLQNACAANTTLAALGYAYGINAIDGFDVGYLLGPAGAAGVFLSTSGTSPYGLGVSVQNLGSAAVPADLPQLTTLDYTGTVTAGWRYSATLGGVAYTYTAASGDDMTDVASGLAALIDAAAAYSATAGTSTSTHAVINVSGAPAVSYSCDTAVLSSTITLAGQLVQSAAS